MFWNEGEATLDGGGLSSTEGLTSGGDADLPLGTEVLGVGRGFSPRLKASFSLRNLFKGDRSADR